MKTPQKKFCSISLKNSPVDKNSPEIKSPFKHVFIFWVSDETSGCYLTTPVLTRVRMWRSGIWGTPIPRRPNSNQPISEPHELEQFKRSEPKLCFLVVENRQTQYLILLKSGLWKARNTAMGMLQNLSVCHTLSKVGWFSNVKKFEKGLNQPTLTFTDYRNMWGAK